MMELGAILCLPRSPLCLQCPVYDFCQTRGEHRTAPRAKPIIRSVAYLLVMRMQGRRKEILLEQRARDASLMPGMFELPPLPLDAVDKHFPLLRLRHSITNTNYQVEVFGEDCSELMPEPGLPSLQSAIAASEADLHWASLQQLTLLPLTGLARKALVRLKLLEAR
jgi:A/G-specific adenine glycosylase